MIKKQKKQQKAITLYDTKHHYALSLSLSLSLSVSLSLSLSFSLSSHHPTPLSKRVLWDMLGQSFESAPLRLYCSLLRE